MGFYSDTPWTSANMWNLSSMTTVGTGIQPRFSLMRRSTLEDGQELHKELAKQ